MCKRSNISYERNIKFMFAHVNHMCKRSNIFIFYGSMPKDVFSLTPPQPMSNVASCRCASAKERYEPTPPQPISNVASFCVHATPRYHDRIIPCTTPKYTTAKNNNSGAPCQPIAKHNWPHCHNHSLDSGLSSLKQPGVGVFSWHPGHVHCGVFHTVLWANDDSI